MAERGRIYLLHFDEPYHHARHYLGWTRQQPEARMADHTSGRGSPLVKAVVDADIGVDLVRVWYRKTRHDERWMKDQNNVKRYCPMCTQPTLTPRWGRR